MIADAVAVVLESNVPVEPGIFTNMVAESGSALGRGPGAGCRLDRVSGR